MAPMGQYPNLTNAGFRADQFYDFDTDQSTFAAVFNSLSADIGG
jgi:hypothetical protein